MNKILFLSLLKMIFGVPPPPPMENPPVPPIMLPFILTKNAHQPPPTQYRYATEWLNRGQSNEPVRRSLGRTPPPPCPAPPHFFASKWINAEKG